ncbi:MAG: secretin N-terminal domain-containing protein [Verrucomicrobiota bacterium]
MKKARFCALVGMGILAALGGPGTPGLQAQPPVGGERVQLQFANLPVREVLKEYERLIDKIVIQDNTLQGTIYAWSRDPVPREEAIRIIEQTLLLNGYTIIPVDANTVKVLGTGRNARTQALPVVTSLSQLPENEQVVSYVMELTYADPEKTIEFLNAYLPKDGNLQNYASVQAMPEARGLVITNTTSNLRNIVTLVEKFDLPAAKVEQYVIPLKRADATKVVEMVETIINADQAQEVETERRLPGAGREAAEAAGNQPDAPIDLDRPEAATAAGTGGVTLSEDAIVVGKVTITPDERTNRVIVVSRPENMPFLNKLIADLDAEVKFGLPVSWPLQQVSALNVLPVLVEILTEPGIETSESGAAATGGTGSQLGGGDSNIGGGGGSGLTLTQEFSTQPIETAPTAVTIGSTRLIADGRTNSIIVMANDDAREKVFEVLRQLDTRSPQVLLNVVIGELTLRSDEEFGIDYFLRNTGTDDVTIGGLNRTTTTPPIEADTLTSLIPFESLLGFGGLTGFISIGSTLDMIVRAFEGSNRFKAISRPSVFTTNNKKAVVASGRQVAVPTQTTTAFVDNAQPVTNSNIEFRDIILRLEVVPIINKNKEVQLEILQTLDTQTGTTVIDNNEIPEISTRLLSTNVSVPNGSTLVLGGLVTSSDDRFGGGIPGLSRIPILGYLFGDVNKSRVRTELVIMVQPTVISGEEMLDASKNLMVDTLATEIETTNREIFQDYVLPQNLEEEIQPVGVLPGPSPEFVPIQPPFPRMRADLPLFDDQFGVSPSVRQIDPSTQAAPSNQNGVDTRANSSSKRR